MNARYFFFLFFLKQGNKVFSSAIWKYSKVMFGIPAKVLETQFETIVALWILNFDFDAFNVL